jgi:hypothetical protein
LRASGLSAPRLVFAQYLVGLAIVRACRDERALGAERGARVRLKWPNDVYVDLPSSSPLVADGGEKKKVGGILVNMSLADGNADVIIGTSSIIHMCVCIAHGLLGHFVRNLTPPFFFPRTRKKGAAST